MLNLYFLIPGLFNKSPKQKKYKTGVALSGGGARGFAHFGVLQVMYEQNIFPDVIAGTSAGAIAGLLIASGRKPREAFEIMKVKKFTEISKIQFPNLGLFSLEKLKKRIRDEISEKNIEDLKLPFFVALTNINTGKIEYINKGPLDILVMASASIPILFSPVEYNGFQYVDGGLLDNLPAEPLTDLCKKIVAINVNPVSEMYNIDNFKDMALRTFHLNGISTLSEVDKNTDIFIAPEGLDKYSILDPSKADEIYQLGYDYAKNLDFSILL
jgi:NTE family protein